MDLEFYLSELRQLHAVGQATEHSYRPALERLFRSIDGELTVINEPQRRRDVGAPDFVFIRKEVSVGWCEAKDLGKDITKFKAGDYSKEQKARYCKALPNLIYTNGIDFEFIRNGTQINFVSIADAGPMLPSKTENFDQLTVHLRDFVQQTPITIGTAQHLASMMAGKAALIKDIMGRALVEDLRGKLDTELNGQYEAFKANLIHDIGTADFADIYAETIAYGLFAARLHDPTLETFSRQEALELLPKSNPFLRSLFGYIAGVDLDDRITWVIDELCAVFRAADVRSILHDFGRLSGRRDPFLHFYETFLAEYNPDKRKARGVWYTPEPVVNFIVRAVDEVLKSEFGLADGLADTSKITIDWDTGQTRTKTDGTAYKSGEKAIGKKLVHRVQILDPATGTGTFLAEVIKLVADRVKGIAPGNWSSYVEQELIPRLHGFELLMASYAMCHMKLDMVLTELGYNPSSNPPRQSVYLTNSLEEGEQVEYNLFARWLAKEANEASNIKRQTPIMCIIGNPPYAGESANKGAWIMDLMSAYKMEPGGKEKLKERNPKWINDDYVKFIRFSEHMIEKNGEGVLGFVTNHGYLDNPTFRGMRWHLLKTFDTIHVLDLHGNSNKKEISPDGSPDINVFDIKQGVAIIIAVKKRFEGKQKDKPLAKVKHGELWGKRAAKNQVLWEGQPHRLSANTLPNRGPQFPFIVRNFDLEDTYQAGFSIADFMPLNSVGIVTARDALTIDFDKEALWNRVVDFTQLEPEELRSKYQLGKDVRDWKVSFAKSDVIACFDKKNIQAIDYRPFDSRWTFYTGNSRGFHCYPRNEVMRNLLKGNNVSLCFTRTIEGGRSFADILVTTKPITHHSLSIKEVNSQCVLYEYPLETHERMLAFSPPIYNKICRAAGLSVTAPYQQDDFLKFVASDRPNELKVFDYIYGVLHSPDYRNLYAEFLKIDFPRIPYPKNPAIFERLSEQGEQLRRLHLMEEAAIGDTPFPFDGSAPEAEDCLVEKISHLDGKVWINKEQFFSGVPEQSWNQYIGGYQPAQKWLKDRKGRTLSWSDIRHYQRIIKVLGETNRLMQEIDVPV